MGFRKDITLESGEVCSYHAVHHFTFDDNGDCIADIGAYHDEISALLKVKPIDSYALRCDGVSPSGNTIREIYCIAAKDPRYVGSASFSEDAAYGLDNPKDPLPAKPVQPSAFHVWDPLAGQWVISNAGLQLAREAAKRQISLARNLQEQAGFDAFGKRFDSDDKSVQRISVVAQAAALAKQSGNSLNIEWTLADNTTIALDADQIMQLPIIMAMTADALHAKSRNLKAAIDAAESIEQIKAIVW